MSCVLARRLVTLGGKTTPRLARLISLEHNKPPPEPGMWSAAPTAAQNSPYAYRPEFLPVSHLTSSMKHGEEFWRAIPRWSDVSAEDFLSYNWAVNNRVEKEQGLLEFLKTTLPDCIPGRDLSPGQSRDDLIRDVKDGVTSAAMSVRITPYILSRINWKDPHRDPIFHQFIPLGSRLRPDHPRTGLDSLGEKRDSKTRVSNIIHRYPHKALFLALSYCGTYCMYCTRSYSVGSNTAEFAKKGASPSEQNWKEAFEYIERHEEINDIVVSGGDAYELPPDRLEKIADRLIAMKNIRRFRIASKGLATNPARVLDRNDGWADTLIRISDKARAANKAVAWHTHFNHPNEVSWITEMAGRKLSQAGVTVRNQSVLLRGINDDVSTMSTLIEKLADMQIIPYYVYQCDMVPKVEHLRTPLQTIIDLESQVRGSIGGFLTPHFVVDLPEGGGKRLACSYESYDRQTGVSRFRAPAIKGRGKENKIYEYHDPLQES